MEETQIIITSNLALSKKEYHKTEYIYIYIYIFIKMLKEIKERLQHNKSRLGRLKRLTTELKAQTPPQICHPLVVGVG